MIKIKGIYRILVFINLFLLLPAQSFADLYMTVSGQVVEKTSNKGLSGVKLVLISWTSGRIADSVSDSKGNYTFKKVPAGEFSIFEELNDNFLVSLPQSIPVKVEKGKNVVGLRIVFERGGAVKGRVITDDNVPIEHATIEPSSGRLAYTDEEGVFMISGVPAGKVNISIIPDHVAPKNIEAISETSKITNIGNVVFNINPNTSIIGIVVDPRGNPVPYAVIKLISEGFPPVTSMARGDGKFAGLGLEATKYNLHIISDGFKSKTIEGVAVPTNHIIIELKPDEGR